METTFISIHDLSLDARLLYVSQSIQDILGYVPNEVIGRSCWEYFHPDEIPFAQAIHGRSIQMDKAANLNYCQVKHKDGRWIGCECVFTVVHDVLVASTSVYKDDVKSDKRRRDAPVIRQLFSSSPKDPRYHMLQYISAKFSQSVPPQMNEPRAALFLNRFSRTLTIMYATNGLADLLGITNDQLTGKSFYYCIQENCLREGVKCLESAKANDSIAYLRFWFRDPRQDDPPIDRDEHMSDVQSSGDDEDGGVHLLELMDHEGSDHAVTTGSSNSMRSSIERDVRNDQGPNSRSSSDNSANIRGNSSDRIFDRPEGQPSRTSSVSTPDEPRESSEPWSPDAAQIELEAVVSCTSDGLVVILRKARTFIPQVTLPSAEPASRPYRNGLFASPWANDPIIPDIHRRSGPLPNHIRPSRFPVNPTAQQVESAVDKGPATEDFMNSIREVAVFAWALTGINGSLAQYGRGTPSGRSQPQKLQIWNPNPNVGPEQSHFAREAHNSGQQNSGSSSFGQSNAKGDASAAIHRYRYNFNTGLPESDFQDSPYGSNSNARNYIGSSAGDIPMSMSEQTYGSRSVGHGDHPKADKGRNGSHDPSQHLGFQPQQQQQSWNTTDGQPRPSNYWNGTANDQHHPSKYWTPPG